MNGETGTGRERLAQADCTVWFLLALIGGILLALAAAVRQRDALCRDPDWTPSGELYPLRAGSSALVVGSLLYFFQQAQQDCCQAETEDPENAPAARCNLFAALLVLLAALIRLFLLNAQRHARTRWDGDAPPDEGGV